MKDFNSDTYIELIQTFDQSIRLRGCLHGGSNNNNNNKKIYSAPFPCKYDQKRVTTDAVNVKRKF